jgi:hypothetical protein
VYRRAQFWVTRLDLKWIWSSPRGRELPPNMPKPRQMGFVMSAKVDAGHMPLILWRGNQGLGSLCD